MSRLHRTALAAVRALMEPEGWECRLTEGGKHSMVEVTRGDLVYRFPFSRGGHSDPDFIERYVSQHARRALRATSSASETARAQPIDDRARIT